MKHILFSLLLLASAAASAAPKKPEANVADRKPLRDPAAPVVLTTSAPGFCLFGAQSGKSYSGEAAFKSVVWKNDVIYVGETHDQPLDHLAQLEALKAMRLARGTKIVVGFEMLNLTLQAQLDDYAAGRLTEQEFLDGVDWKKEWGFDFSIYKPLFDFIREHKLRALALNVPRKVVSKIARTGLESLEPEERRYLPEKIDVTKHKKYNEYLRETFDGHGGSPMARMFTIENYQASMAAWNEGMAARLAEFLNANPGYAALVIAGNGHLMYNAAIPASLKSRTEGLRQASFYTEHAETCPEKMPAEHKNIANYIWYIKHPPKPAQPAAEPAAISTAAAAAEPVADPAGPAPAPAAGQ